MSSIEWLTSTVVAPVWRWYSLIWPRIVSRPSGSSPAAGSSSTSSFGSIASTPAMATRRFCPPESSNGLRASHASSMPQNAAALRTRASISSRARPMLPGPNAMSL